jgi:gamma-glutamyltranspeptidase/glutathione hydrolase
VQFFLNVVDFGMDLQDAIDAPSYHTAHAPSSFYPRQSHPREIVIEGRVPGPVIEDLRARGHTVQVVGNWSLNYTTAAVFDGERGLIEAAASSRGERNYALGW